VACGFQASAELRPGSLAEVTPRELLACEHIEVRSARGERRLRQFRDRLLADQENRRRAAIGELADDLKVAHQLVALGIPVRRRQRLGALALDEEQQPLRL
jgi:hypothetical protein